MYSMTGYGKGVAERGGIKITAEIKSVNHRFLDVSVKSPKLLSFGDETVRRVIKEKIVRGHLDVYISAENDFKSAFSLRVNSDIAGEYFNAAKTLSAMFDIENDLTAVSLMRISDVVELRENEADTELLSEVLAEAVSAAVSAVFEMRKKEGANITADLLAKLDELEKRVAGVELRAPRVAAEHKDKLKQRVSEYLGDVAVDESRLLNEVAFFADKAGIDEEIMRLKSHIKRFKELASADGAVGKQLDFIVQEMNREANTIGSKNNDLEISSAVLTLKNEIEKIREQIQNIE